MGWVYAALNGGLAVPGSLPRSGYSSLMATASEHVYISPQVMPSQACTIISAEVSPGMDDTCAPEDTGIPHLYLHVCPCYRTFCRPRA